MVDLKTLLIFVRVGDRRSFVGAAQDLGMTQSGVSTAISRLEGQLGVRLLARTTRNVKLTEDGAAFLDRCRQILGDLEDAERVLTQARSKPTGRLRIDLPVLFGRMKILPLLGAFQAQHPDLQLAVSFSPRWVDLIEAGIDVVVRVGVLADSTLISRRLGETTLRIVGSPSYFARHGMPQTPADLASHNCLGFVNRDACVAKDWHLRSDGVGATLRPRGTMSFNDGAALCAAAQAGFGLAQLQDFFCERAIAAGKLESVLDEFSPCATPISVVYPQTRHLSRKVRAFVDFLIGQFR